MEIKRARINPIGLQRVELKQAFLIFHADQNFIGKILDHLIWRIDNCTKTCIICDGELPFQMIKPAVCGKSLCVHSHEQYGLGADVASEVRDSPDVVDLLLLFCYGIRWATFGRKLTFAAKGITADSIRFQLVWKLNLSQKP